MVLMYMFISKVNIIKNYYLVLSDIKYLICSLTY